MVADVLAAAAVEQGERVAGLQPQHLHVARGNGGQVEHVALANRARGSAGAASAQTRPKA
jgi:hypothetical protein